MFQLSRCSKKVTIEVDDAAAAVDRDKTIREDKNPLTMTSGVVVGANNEIATSKPKLKPAETYDFSSSDSDDDSLIRRRKIKNAEKEKLRQTLQNVKLNLTSKAKLQEESSTPDKSVLLKTIVKECLQEIPDPSKSTVGQVMRRIAMRMKIPKLSDETKAEAKRLLIELFQQQKTSQKTTVQRSIPPASDTHIDKNRKTTAVPTNTNVSTVASDLDLKCVVQACIDGLPDPLQISVRDVMQKIALHLKLTKLPAETEAAARQHLVDIVQARKLTELKERTKHQSDDVSCAKETSDRQARTATTIATTGVPEEPEKSTKTTEASTSADGNKRKTSVLPRCDEAATVPCRLNVNDSKNQGFALSTNGTRRASRTDTRNEESRKCSKPIQTGADKGTITRNTESKKCSERTQTDAETNTRKRDTTTFGAEDPAENPPTVKKPRAKTKNVSMRASEDSEHEQKSSSNKTNRKPPSNETKKMATAEVTGKPTDASPPKKTRKSSAKRCRWCNQCSCQKTKVAKTLGTHSSIAIEKALIKRLVQLESTADHYDAQADDVRRQLQKHRRNLYQRRKKLLAKQTNERDQQKIFILPDVDALEQKFDSMSSKPRTTQKDAKERLFAFTRAPQRTLTQLVGGEIVAEGTSELGDDDGLVAIQNSESTEPKENAAEKTPIDFALEDEAALSFAPANVERRDPDHHESVWKAGRSGCFQTDWDNLFLQQLEKGSADDAMDQLVNLFGTPETPSKENTVKRISSPYKLSARGKNLAEQVINDVESNESRKRSVEMGCIDWKENIHFTMAQRETEDLADALKNVRDAKERLAKERTRIMEFLDQRSSTLELFENTLERSLGRLATHGRPAEAIVVDRCTSPF